MPLSRAYKGLILSLVSSQSPERERERERETCTTDLTMKLLLLSLLLSLASAQLSPTTSTLYGERRTHQSGELIFDEEFDKLDFRMWQHEITMSGGGNWEFQVRLA